MLFSGLTLFAPPAFAESVPLNTEVETQPQQPFQQSDSEPLKTPWAPGPLSEQGSVVREVLREGTHWRLVTANGPVHVFKPRGYDGATAGTVLYVHGYYTTVDEAWEQHRLMEQFALARKNAIYIACEAPVSNPDTVKWDRPGDLLAEVHRLTHLRIPDGPLVVVGHSGAFRTIIPWLESNRIDEIMLLDGLYLGTDEFRDWMQVHPRARNHRLVLVGIETSDKTEQVLLPSVKGVAVRNDIPTSARQFTTAERHARVLYLKSQYGHMEMVTEGQVLPVLLGLAPLPSTEHGR